MDTAKYNSPLRDCQRVDSHGRESVSKAKRGLHPAHAGHPASICEPSREAPRALLVEGALSTFNRENNQ
jgi:hypothetical protein